MSYIKVPNDDWVGINNTGFGDRMRYWTYAYKLNEINDFNYTILADDYKWRELKYLDFPYTESGINVNSDNSVILDDKTHPHKHIHGSKATLPSRAPELYFGRLTRHTHKGDSWKDSTKAKEVANTDWFLDTGMELDSDVISLIKLKDVVLKNKIKELVKDRIGIHIRHWPIFREDENHNSMINRFDYESKMSRTREVLDRYNSKFYISTDVTYDKPALGPSLPDFRKESHWVSEIYRDYDVVDYRDIISVDDIFPMNVKDRNNLKWPDHHPMTRVYDTEGEQVSVRLSQDGDLDVMPVDKIYDRKSQRDVVDLFSLIYSKEFVSATETGIDSTWSEFVKIYRKNI